MTTRKVIFLMLSIFGIAMVGTGVAQTVDYNKIILPKGAEGIEFAERLVQLAWQNNPENEVLKHNENIAELNVSTEKVRWLDIFGAQGNLNEFTINNNNANPNGGLNQFPRYNLNATVTLGMFFKIPYGVKKGKENLAIAQHMVNARKLEIRQVVLSSYNTYNMHKEILSIQTQALEDAGASFSLIEQKFKNGEASLDQYNKSVADYNRFKVTKLQAENDFLNSKLALERLIGVRLEDVN